jgi:hypothetical protein
MEFPARQALVVIKIPARHENFHLKRLSLLDPSFSHRRSKMSGGVPSQISLDNAVVAQDEMGRPFIIVREYPPLPCLLTCL